MTRDEIISKHAAKLWNNSSCPVHEIMGDLLNEALELAAQEADRECEKLTAAKNAAGNTELGRKLQSSVWTAMAISVRIRALKGE